MISDPTSRTYTPAWTHPQVLCAAKCGHRATHVAVTYMPVSPWDFDKQHALTCSRYGCLDKTIGMAEAAGWPSNIYPLDRAEAEELTGLDLGDEVPA